MQPHELLRCVPARVLARYRDSEGHDTLEKREKAVAIVFVDVEGCTRLCEDLPPQEMNGLLETYFSSFFDAIEGAGGMVNEIMGDGFMAIFEEGELASNTRSAVSAALAIERATEGLNARRPGMHDPLAVNIGIHAGLGFVGFSKFRAPTGERWTYTASGPVTNIAARLCDLASGGSILVSAEVAGHLDTERYCLESLGPQKLKNVSQPVMTFRLREKRIGARGSE
jgi:class 3 adenylate cyclase